MGKDMRRTGFFCFTLLVAAMALCFTACGGETYLTSEGGGAAYRLQGEYSGAVQSGEAEAEEPIGVQVIALGKGRFRAVFYPGGLPGQGWCGKEKKVAIEGHMAGEAEEARVEFGGAGYRASCDGDRLIGSTGEGARFEADKVHRRSPTLGVRPPERGRVLFDGADAEAWQGGRVDEQGRLQAGTRTKEAFRSIRLHVEFMTPFEPSDRGQGRGNSGVFFPGGWEVQVLDSFGLEGRDNECGGLYGTADPRVNMCLPPLTWQTYDIEYHAGEQQGDQVSEMSTVTVWHNGVVVHDRVPLRPVRPGRARTVEGTIRLQQHGNKVFYRNVWVVELDQ